ncbi:MAG: hypothetical protein LBV49_10690 [Azonexus sp.]|jgi:hypothetical protein|nr:hypothetical protein [Azonexus sp.]
MPEPQHAYDWPSYLRWLFVICLATVMTCALLNIVTDPLAVFGMPRIAGFNAVKPYPDHHRQLSRLAAARRICAPVGIFGNSRAEIGFDPRNPDFSALGGSAFNHAIPGSGASGAYRQLLWLKAAGCLPKTIILGVEFFDFLGGAPAARPPTLAEAPPPTLDQNFLAESVFSISGLREALNTILIQRAEFPASITEYGFNPLRNYLQEVGRYGHHALFRQRGEENLRNWSRKPLRLRPPDGGPSDDETAIAAILDLATTNGSRVELVIYPYHAEIRLLLEGTGMSALFTDWKRLLFRLAADRIEHGGNIEVWDFSGISDETMEAIPAPGDHHTHLAYYWEAGHFKKELGDRVIARIAGQNNGFGLRLEPATLEAWLAADRARVITELAHPSPLKTEVEHLISGAGQRR